MARYELSADRQPDLAVAPAPDWPLPVAVGDGDDWSGVIGCCHALRPPPAAPPALPADDAEDWGYEQVAC